MEKLVDNYFCVNGPSILSDPTFHIKDYVKEMDGVLEGDCKELFCLSVHQAQLMLDKERYNDLRKSVRIMVYVMRFISNYRHSKQGNYMVRGPLTTHELCVGENKLIYIVQREAFSEEIKALSSNNSIS